MYNVCVRRALAVAVLCATSGCATLPREQGLSDIHALVEQRSGALSWSGGSDSEASIMAELHALVAQPLTADGAVQVALLRNPRMQSEYARLGIAEADVYEASRIGNPTLSVTALHHSGEPTKFDAGLSVGFAELLMLPARKRLAAGEYARTQASIGAAILDLASDTRAAWYGYVSAQQVAAMRDAVAEAAQASADLAARFLRAGNISALQCKLEEAGATQARLQALRARADAVRARSALTTLMGLSGGDAAWTVADRLPAPLAADDTADTLLPLARRQRLDRVAAQQELASLEQGLDVARRYRLLGKVDIGVAGERETDRSKLYGPSLTLQLPIFDQGQASVARATAQRDAARARLQSLDLEIDAAVRLGAERVAATRRVAEEYRAALIPQREAIVARTQEQQNYMLVGVFELLLAKQQEFDAYQGYLEAVRDYWLARVDLARAVGARLPGDATPTEATIGPDEVVHPAPESGMSHMHHDGMTMPRNVDGSDPAAAETKAPVPGATKKADEADKPHRHHGGMVMPAMNGSPGAPSPPANGHAPRPSGDVQAPRDHGEHDAHGGPQGASLDVAPSKAAPPAPADDTEPTGGNRHGSHGDTP